MAKLDPPDDRMDGGSEAAAEVERTGDRILVVDDDPAVCDLLERHLWDAGYRVLVAEDGIRALGIIHREVPDLILLDLVIPHMNGIQLCRKLRSDPRFEGTPVILLSAETETPMKVEGLVAGANDYVTKPFEMEEVLARVRSHLQTKRLQEKLQEMQESVITSGKREAVMELAGATAHEMNQPLTALLGRVSLLRRRIDEDDPVRKDLDIIEEQAERIHRCVNKLASVSSYDTKPYIGERKILDLDQSSTAEERTDTVIVCSGGSVPRETIEEALGRAGLEEIPVDGADQIRDAWTRSRASAIVLEIADPGSILELVDQLEQDLETPTLPLILLDPAGGAVSPDQVDAYGIWVLEGAAPSSDELATSLRRASQVGQGLRTLESRDRELGVLRVVDPLTGAARRAHFLSSMEGEVLRARRYRYPVSLALLDVDDFGEANRAHGLAFGDRVLRELGHFVRRELREADHLGRLGGELFGLVLPHTTPEECRAAVERWRSEIGRERGDVQVAILSSVEASGVKGPFHLTLSVGIAGTVDGCTPEGEELLERCQRALRRAKGEGKDRVVVDVAPWGTLTGDSNAS